MQAGRGGDGGLSFRREKFVPKGARTAATAVRVATSCSSATRLSAISPRSAAASSSRAGGVAPARATTSTARLGTVELGVPAGTQVFDDEEQLVADLASPGARVLVARGGAGGRGTSASLRRRARRRGSPRSGFPVRRPSSSCAPAARRRGARRLAERRQVVADSPHLEREPEGRRIPVHHPGPGARDGGRSGRGGNDRRRRAGADRGARQGIGLGHEFLAHLERAQLLVHVIDVAAGDRTRPLRQSTPSSASTGRACTSARRSSCSTRSTCCPSRPVFPIEDERVQAVFAVSCATGAGIEDFRRALFHLCPPRGDGRAASGRARRFPGVPPAGEGAANIPDPSHRPRFPRRRAAAASGGARGGLACRRSATGAEIEIGDDRWSSVDRPPRGAVRSPAQRPRRARTGGAPSSCPSSVWSSWSRSGRVTGAVASAADRLQMASAAFEGLGEVVLDTRTPWTQSAAAGSATRTSSSAPTRRLPFHLERARRDPAVGATCRRDPLRLRGRGHVRPRLAGHLGTEVRERVARGEPIDDLVPPAVARIIEERGSTASRPSRARSRARRPRAPRGGSSRASRA